ARAEAGSFIVDLRSDHRSGAVTTRTGAVRGEDDIALEKPADGWRGLGVAGDVDRDVVQVVGVRPARTKPWARKCRRSGHRAYVGNAVLDRGVGGVFPIARPVEDGAAVRAREKRCKESRRDRTDNDHRRDREDECGPALVPTARHEVLTAMSRCFVIE